jgi:hypothetical protein
MNGKGDDPRPMQAGDIWTMAADHDSCWTDGVSRTISDLEREAWKYFGDVVPSTHAHFDIFTQPTFRKVEYELEKGQDQYGRKYIVTMSDRLNRLEAAQLMKEMHR